MALIELFRPGEFIPAGTYAAGTQIGLFEVTPAPGEGWRMFIPQTAGNSVFRGRFANKPAGFTSITAQIGIGQADIGPRFGAAQAGLEATILTLNSTSIQSANTWMMPYVRLLAEGTAGTNDTDLRLQLLLGFPVVAFRVVAAANGMPWQVGQNLLNPIFGRSLLW